MDSWPLALCWSEGGICAGLRKGSICAGLRKGDICAGLRTATWLGLTWKIETWFGL